MMYSCSKGCGACCTRVGANMELLKKFDFPYGVKEDGKTCEKLDEKTRLCTVYLNRPEVCQIDLMYYKTHFKHKQTKKEFFLNESKICNSFMNADGIDKSFRVNEEQYK